MHSDRVLKCRGCGTDFAWSTEEQQFFDGMGLRHAPRRCKACRVKRKSATSAAVVRETAPRHLEDDEVRPVFMTTCCECRQAASVPFLPDPSRAAYCTDCFRRRRALVSGSPAASATTST